MRSKIMVKRYRKAHGRKIANDASIFSRLHGDGPLGRDQVSLGSSLLGSATGPPCRSPSLDEEEIGCFDIFTRDLQGFRGSFACFIMFAARE